MPVDDTSTSVPRITLGDLRRLAEGFRYLCKQADGLRTTPQPYLEPSPAAAEAANPTLKDHVLELLSLTNIRMAAALDYCDALLRFAESAAAGRPTPAFAPHSTARSAVEMCATVHWLVEPDLDAFSRAARTLSLVYQETRNQKRLGGAHSAAELARVESQAGLLGFQMTGRLARRGFLSEMPTLSDRVQGLLGDARHYCLLSAASHGDSWALIELAYIPDHQANSVWGRVMKKVPPAWGLATPLLQTFQALARATWQEATYRGWDTGHLQQVLEDSYDRASLKPGIRFWRGSPV